MARVVLSLGSNIEPRRDYLARALAALSALPETRLEAASEVEETEPVGVPPEYASAKFLNQVAVFATTLAPHDFARRMHAVEDDLGRVRGPVRNVPRTIDVDMVDYDGMALDDPELTLPHPRAMERDFVRRPWQELVRRLGGAARAAIVAAAVLAAGAARAVLERDVVRASGPWEMEQATAPGKWMRAVVPGTVLSTLVANRVVADPCDGLNNRWEDKVIPDLSDSRDFYTATYRTRVTLPAAFTNRVVWMRPEGINYRGEIYLNGRLVASTRGMFARNAVDVTEFARPGAENDVVVKVWPVDHPGAPMPKGWGAANGEWHNGGDGQIGRNVTMLMTAGWDFTFSDGVRDRNTGIWRDLTFFATDRLRLDAPYVRTKLDGDMRAADLTLELDVHNSGYGWGDADVPATVTAEVEGTDVRFRGDVRLYRGERRTVFLKARMPQPELWWPRNKGGQRLYTLTARIADAKGRVSDEVKVRFGVREVTSDRSGAAGARQFYVNRRKVFVRGTNWIPDAMLRCDDARMGRIMRLVADSGVNLVRLWGGGIVESERFYDLCDEYGLFVWQEFWMTGDTRHPDDPALYLDNVAQSVRRIRSHAAACHWVASNESTEVTGTEELVKRLTGTTSWMMQSECDGVHDGSPYVSVNPMRHYADEASDRGRRVCGFNPEYGATALPCAANLRSFMPERLLWPVGENAKAWNYREGGGFNGMTTLHHALVNAYGASRGIDDYCVRSEAADYMQQRAVWECWNRARNEATGVLYWYENPPNPQLAVHGWDYDLRPTPMFYAQRRALRPLHIQYEYLSNTVSVCSDEPAGRRVRAVAEVWTFESAKVWEKAVDLAVAGETSADAFTIPFADLALAKPHFIRLRLLSPEAEGARELDAGFYWRSNDAYRGPKTVTGPCTAGFAELADLPPAKLECRRAAGGWRIANTGDTVAFLVKVEPANGSDIVCLPDNWFSLLPGESVSWRHDEIRCGDSAYAGDLTASDYPTRLKAAANP